MMLELCLCFSAFYLSLVLRISLFLDILLGIRLLTMASDPITLGAAAIDPFCRGGNDMDEGLRESIVHIRVQQRNGRKMVTTVQGIHPDYDLKKLAKVFKKEFACNGSVSTHKEFGEVVQLTGDQRGNIKEFLINTGICRESNIKLHGF